MIKDKLKLTPFYDATKDVFKSMLDLDISKLENNEKLNSEENVKVEIALIGDLSGTVIYNFPKSTTLNIVKTLSGMEFNDLDDFSSSMLGEMANIISGNAVTSLSEMNYKCDPKPPNITTGNSNADKDGSSVDMFLHSNVGEMCEHICLSQNI